jgi:Fic family protein
VSELLYLSLYFKTYRQQYYQLLNEVRLTGDWESWLEFFAEAMIETIGQAIDTIQQLTQLIKADGKEIDKLSRISGSVHTIHKAMIEKPIKKLFVKNMSEFNRTLCNLQLIINH